MLKRVFSLLLALLLCISALSTVYAGDITENGSEDTDVFSSSDASGDCRDPSDLSVDLSDYLTDVSDEDESSEYPFFTGRKFYFDSENGKDTNRGRSPARAFRSVSKIAELDLKAGDTLLFRSGCHFEGSFEICARGTDKRPVTLTTYGGDDRAFLYIPGDGTVLSLFDSSYVDISHFDITLGGSNGHGMTIMAINGSVDHVELNDLYFHDICPGNHSAYKASEKSCLYITNKDCPVGENVRFLTARNCEFANCSYGMNLNGRHILDDHGNAINDGHVRNRDILFESCYFHDIDDDAMTIGDVDRFTLRNSSVISTCLFDDYPTAPCWMHRCSHVLLDSCEIADSRNPKDGMPIDFDCASTDCLAQRLYTHDNARFFWSVKRADINRDNTIRYCLSVNDNATRSGGYIGYSKTSEYTGFKFYNNTVVNCHTITFDRYPKAMVRNNIFIIIGGQNLYLNTDLKGAERVLFSNNLYVDYGQGARYPSEEYRPGNYRISDPGFVGYDFNEPDRFEPDDFRLAIGSPALGTGMQAEDDMGDTDLWGNPIGTKHNIGCYEGKAVDPVTGKEYFRRGDADVDGGITATDARLTLRTAVKLEPEPEDISFMDADKNGVIQAADARLILRAAVGLDTIKD